MAETKYDENFPERAMDFASEGMTDSQIAYQLGISRSTFYNYKQQHSRFAEAIDVGRDVIDSRVENRLLELALGNYTITIHVTDHEGRTRTTVKDAIPNLKAIQYWLERSDRRKGILPETKEKKTVVEISPVSVPEAAKVLHTGKLLSIKTGNVLIILFFRGVWNACRTDELFGFAQ